MKKLDMYIVLGVLVMAGIMFTVFNLQPSDHAEVVVSVRGEEYERVAIDGREHVIEIVTETGYNKIVVDEHGVHVEVADCPDHDCMEIGTISKVGQSIICAPNYIVIQIMGNADAEMDSMAI
ncbi:MAG TPA: hypothetical protein DCY20_11785 [Firmicutes bacterium]|nr:hypothetical protein [Bacillota bacterium]